jgi:hypothetical protein
VEPDFALVEPYTSKTAAFKFRGVELRFALSHGLFSSAGIDRGTALLLKVLSRLWDEDQAAGRHPPQNILDAGCGAGIIAVCAAAALKTFHIRAQDRDELARLFTAYNARANGIDPDHFSARAEALLSGPPGARWDLILSNIPAKAGRPVLEHFVRRAALLLNPGGNVVIVAVNTLADFFRAHINQAGAALLREEPGPEHTVFVYTAGGGKPPPCLQPVNALHAFRGLPAPPSAGGPAAPPAGGKPRTRGAPRNAPGQNPEADNDFLAAHPCYLRRRAEYELEGLPLGLDTIHGAAGFDRPGGAAEAAAKLAIRLGRERIASAAAAVLVHEPEQGWFPAWLLAFLAREGAENRRPIREMAVSGRNILALEAARHNIRSAAQHPPEISIIPAVELSSGGLAGLLESGGSGAAGPGGEKPPAGFGRGRFGLIAAFPETVPRTDRRAALWDGVAAFLAPGGLAILALPSSEAERLDRVKPPGLRRLGDLKRKGFRALACEKIDLLMNYPP